MDEPLNAVFWLMKDFTIPPVLKLNGAELGAVMGATLATKRSVAERLAEGIDPDSLVFEPYANPFRVYPLGLDYERFKQILQSGIDCYILNTGDFMGKKVPAYLTFKIIESIIAANAQFHKWESFDNIEIMDIEGFEASFRDKEYKNKFIARINDRIDFVKSREYAFDGRDRLPAEALKQLENLCPVLVG